MEETGKYEKCIAQWDDIFSEASLNVPSSRLSGNETLDKTIMWVCDGTESILDFGCGDGTMLFLCALNGTKHHIGIDLSEKAIQNAKERACQMPVGEYRFWQGSIEELENMESSSVDAAILFNILDNLYPEDAETLLREVHRILTDKGKVLVKLNQHLTQEQIIEWNIKVIKDNFLDDGLLLLNYTTEMWEHIFEKDFKVISSHEIYFPEYEQTNRMFYLTKK